MVSKNCGHCNYQGDLKQRRIFCAVDQEWYDMGHSCEHWIEFSGNMRKEDRLRLASDLRSRIDAEKSHTKDVRLRWIFLIVGFLLGILSMWIKSLFFPSG
jgi:hypothetical protein